ncbi:hypothetical protein [uncultured Kordia sp.]|uniref:hypothetical protein n=1 Tax=uncultured Kordia sp. TaxID=507699 RepID=UPI002610D664|nr:hypothetical protein [uncultured Kordia sp.]
MKKRNVNTLSLNKRKISELHTIGGRNGESTNCPTASGCSCETCRPGCALTIKPVSDVCTR